MKNLKLILSALVVLCVVSCKNNTAPEIKTIEVANTPKSVTKDPNATYAKAQFTVNGMTAKIQIWDTAGQEQFKRLAPMYYKNAAAAIICYDVTSPKSFETLECKVFETMFDSVDFMRSLNTDSDLFLYHAIRLDE